MPFTLGEMIKRHRSNHRIWPFSSQTHRDRLRQSGAKPRQNTASLRKWRLEIEKVGSMSVRCAPSPLRTTTAGSARAMPTLHGKQSIPSTFPIARAVWPAQCGLARVSRDKGRDGSSLSCSCCQFVSCWWEARGLMSVVLAVVCVCGGVPAPSMASGWWCGLGVRLVLIGVCGWLWWLVGALCSACCCLCAPADHGLEKMFAKCVALWISTLYLC